MIKVLHIFPTFSLGGQQRRLATLIDGIGDEFYHSIISLNEELEAAELINSTNRFGVRSVPAIKSGMISIPMVRRLRDIILNQKPDMLCTYNWGAIEAVLAWRSIPNNNRPGHLHFEDGFGPGESGTTINRKRSFARSWILAKSHLAVPSRQLEVIARNHWRIKAKRLIRIMNGVDGQRFARHAVHAESNDGVHIGTVGALRQEKNLFRLIDAIAILYEQFPDCQTPGFYCGRWA